jgi:hypothetical protein
MTSELQVLDAPSGAHSRPGIPRLRLHAIAAMIGLIGVILRVRFFASIARTSLSTDEMALALNFERADLGQLFRPLGFDQAAPVGFLILEKLSTAVLGSSEPGLRFLPLLAAILVLPLSYVLFHRFLSPESTLIGLGLVALSPVLIFWGAHFKQYSFDVLVALFLLIMALPGFCETPSRGQYMRFGIVGAIAIWCSFPAVFVIGGIGLTLIVWNLRGGRPLPALLWTASSAFCALSFGIGYLVSFRHYAGNDGLQWWWTFAFAPFPPRSLTDAKWYMDSFLKLFDLLLWRGRGYERGLAAVMAVLGAYSPGASPRSGDSCRSCSRRSSWCSPRRRCTSIPSVIARCSSPPRSWRP